jgi:hypothetical protein
MGKKEMKTYSQYLMGGSLAAVLMAAFGYMGSDIWLASTQWLLVAAVLAMFGVYLKMD